MTKGNVVRSNEGLIKEDERKVTFSTDYHELTFWDNGDGISVIIPEWDGIALVLQKRDVERLRALVYRVVVRP